MHVNLIFYTNNINNHNQRHSNYADHLINKNQSYSKLENDLENIGPVV